MKFGVNNIGFSKMQFIDLKTDDWIVKQRYAGNVLAQCLDHFRVIVESHQPSLNLLQIEDDCDSIILKHDCTPTFAGYNGFPGKVCLSVNNELVHGIPKDYILQDGDIVTLDLGVTFQGAISDAALTVIYGKAKSPIHKELIYQCEEALYRAIKSISVGKRIGSIGKTISKYIRSNSNFGLITEYGGHGLSWDKPHTQPFVSNKSQSDDGVRFTPGLTIAIEPMLTISGTKTHKSDDKWTVVTRELNSHAEHTIFIHNDCIEIMTWQEYEHDRCPNKLYFEK